MTPNSSRLLPAEVTLPKCDSVCVGEELRVPHINLTSRVANAFDTRSITMSTKSVTEKA